MSEHQNAQWYTAGNSMAALCVEEAGERKILAIVSPLNNAPQRDSWTAMLFVDGSYLDLGSHETDAAAKRIVEMTLLRMTTLRNTLEGETDCREEG